VIAAQAQHLTVFPRTPNYRIPARNRRLTDDERTWWRANYARVRQSARREARNGIFADYPVKGALEDDDETRRRRFEGRWEQGGIPFMSAYNDISLNESANDTAANFVREKIGAVVKDPGLAALLQPTSYPIGTKRICLDTDYFETFNRDNVTLVDVRAAPIERITAAGVRAGGTEHALDAIVLATGFDAMTGSFAKLDIRGRRETLNAKWAEGPKTYLGLMIAGFPNMFMITGPGSPSVLSNMMVSIEQHVDWIADCLAWLRERDIAGIEAAQQAEDQWVAHVNEVAQATLYPRAASWYMGANIPGKPRVFLPYIGGVPVYRQICDDVAAKGYEGFALTPRHRAAAE